MSRDELEIVTPEQVPLRFLLASSGDRILALLVDLLVLAVGLLLLLAIAWMAGGDAYLHAVVLLGVFLLVNFYFAGTELRWQGRTIGKRALGLRVVARDGGPLTAGMVLSRNLTRDLELYLPIAALFAPEEVLASAPVPVRWLALGWLFVIAALPFANRQRARLGDLVAGTVVVATPKAVLLDDLVREAPPSAATGLSFTQAELDIYGIEELHVLEQVLRSHDPAPELLADITARIQRKIGWQSPGRPVPPLFFLRAFYAAQRQRLEHKMLLGRRQARKVR
ncbi:MAG: RDD family protein [Myxococcales bacterium]|nr:RDD family protein [Myxococcales bacterium]